MGAVDGPSAGRFYEREHHLDVRVYYGDTDFTGIVYHANHLRYLERGRSDYLRLAGTDHTSLLDRPDPCAFVITRMQIDFRKAARIDDALMVVTAYDRIAGPRLHISQTIRRNGMVIAKAAVEAACITPDGRPRRPPPELVQRLAPRLLAANTP